jgi:hypothetical protein
MIAGMVAVPALTVVVVPVAGPFAPFAFAAVDDFEVGAAATVNPDAVAVVSPGAVEDAVSFAALADDEDAVARVRGAEVAVHVIGRAINQGSGAGLPVAGNAEIRTTAAVNPNAALTRTPSLTLNASGLTALANHADAETSVSRAPGTPHVIGGAVDDVGFAPAAEFIVASAEITVMVVIAVHVMAVEVSVPAMVVNNVAASAIDAKKEKLLIVAAIGRKDLEELPVAVRTVWQIQCLTVTGDNLHEALVEIFDSP